MVKVNDGNFGCWSILGRVIHKEGRIPHWCSLLRLQSLEYTMCLDWQSRSPGIHVFWGLWRHERRVNSNMICCGTKAWPLLMMSDITYPPVLPSLPFGWVRERCASFIFFLLCLNVLFDCSRWPTLTTRKKVTQPASDIWWLRNQHCLY